MKVGILVPGGVDRSGEYRVVPCLLWLIERLARTHELHVFALRQDPRPSRYELLGAQVHNIGAAPRRARMAMAIAVEHRRGHFDLLHAFWAVPQGTVAALVGRVFGIPVVLHITGGDLASLPGIGYGGVMRRRGRLRLRGAVAGASRVTTPSTQMQRAAAELGISAERLPLGVALDRWPPLAPSLRDPLQSARLLHVASLNLVKDQTTLIRAVRKLHDDGYDFHLDVVGGDTLDGRIQALTVQSGLGEKVTFHGFLPHSRLRPLIERAHVMLLSSRHEADPVVLFEAAVAGLPTVSTAVGHVPDWAPHAARSVRVGDHLGLARETATLLESEEVRMEVAAAAQARATAEDADWSAARVEAIYNDLVRPG